MMDSPHINTITHINPGMILSRGLGYYTELLVSAVLTIVANFTIGKGKKVRENVGNL